MALSAFVRSLEAIGEEFAEATPPWDPEAILFAAQLEVFRDRTSPRIVVDCSRRSGKSFLAAVLLTDMSLKVARHNALYLTQSSEDTRDILWKLVKELNDTYALGGRTNDTRMEITYPNGSFIRLLGCKDHNEARRRIKGRRWHFVIIDEGQNFPDYLEEMVEAGLIPTLMGRGGVGRIMMAGTPGPVPGIGYYEEAVCGGKWKVYHWTIRENASLDQAEVETYLASRADTLGATSAIHLREDLGERPPADETTGLVYVYNRKINDPLELGFAAEQVVIAPGDRDGRGRHVRWVYALDGKWHVGIGMDLGHAVDATALVALGVNEAAPGLAFLIEEYIAPKRLLPPGIAEKLGPMVDHWSPLEVRCDEGGLGVSIADQVRADPFRLPVSAADKLHPLASADALNTALTTGKFLLRPQARAAVDMGRVRWDPEARKKGKRREALRPHSDVLPACRYIWPVIASLIGLVRHTPPKARTETHLEELELKRLRSIRVDARQGWRSW